MKRVSKTKAMIDYRIQRWCRSTSKWITIFSITASDVHHFTIREVFSANVFLHPKVPIRLQEDQDGMKTLIKYNPEKRTIEVKKKSVDPRFGVGFFSCPIPGISNHPFC